ncbi:DegT/DnrJ/EryC1/StrS aminotransferase [Thecamonas trahens ATCC 50062]|uniref:DegT/DnrJ/EryC1/StrS aminotransferase n=1 Tax=Thecamonas trahens ATCC 50062 TaxID=461836 RepID=A0A0L0D5P0_THETB|nr:DegT/DnrJ/EryC1/StrS aminotransferase [Thecamonas trahens ATCC 50062]KNC47525.1 DegT/DnrJ/EryC1/StrS aminotransferase [Thecamonas trahens ATCC 50062]|eukprot:XP_013759459.1 DegT/DnrJ/EryC1/StrS aminotransferase [Thecamonas trahens ATCC 50062]
MLARGGLRGAAGVSATGTSPSEEKDETGEPLIARKQIKHAQPWLTQAEEDAVASTVASGRLTMGPATKEFEASVAAFAGRTHAVAASSGTAALQLALAAKGVGPGWTVVLPAYTWVATYNAVVLAGATPVLADVDPLAYTIDPAATVAALDSAVTGGADPGKMAIMPVHMFGYRAGAGWLPDLARERDLTVIGDGCCSFGGIAGGERCGAWSPLEAFSFHPRKVVTAGEGGMLLTDDDEVAAKLRALRDHGAHRSAEQRRQTGAGGPMVPEFELGYNFRITEMQAALGAAQMLRIGELLRARRDVGLRYDELLVDGPAWLRPPPRLAGGPGAEPDGDDRILTFYPVTLWGSRADDAPAKLAASWADGDAAAVAKADKLGAWRDRLMGDLAAAGVAARPPMLSLPDLPYVQERSHLAPTDYPVSSLLARLTFSLPLHHEVTWDDQRQIVRLLREIPSSWHSLDERIAAVDRALGKAQS